MKVPAAGRDLLVGGTPALHGNPNSETLYGSGRHVLSFSVTRTEFPLPALNGLISGAYFSDPERMRMMMISTITKGSRHVGCVRWSIAALIFVCLSSSALASAEHRGLVRFGGQPVPGATVTAIQGDKRLATVTGPFGDYSFPDLADGVWTIQIEMLCFAAVKSEVTVAADAPAPEFELKLLPLNEIKAEERAAAPAMPAPKSPATAQESRAKTEQAPRPAADAQGSFQKAELTAAAASGAAAGPERESGVFGNQSAEDLAQRASDGFLISGSANNSASSPFGLMPAFGNARKGPVSLYNGNIGLTLGNSALDARSYSLTGQDTARPAYNRVTGMASFGGPLRIPRLWKNGPMFVVNYQWTRNRNVTTQSGLMPTSAERDGDLSRTLNALGRPVEIFDPVTGLQFSGNAIPKNRISPQAKALLDLFPPPNFVGGTRYNYQIPVVGATHQDSLQTRLSKTIKRNNQLSGTFDYQRVRSDNPNLLGFLDKTDSTGLNTGINWRRTFTMRLLFNVGYQYSRLATRNSPFFQNRRNISGEAGILGNNQEPVNWGPPDLVFAGGITSLSDGRPSFNRNQTNALTYSMFWSRGRHNLSFGGEFRRQQFNYLAQQDPRGTFTFTGAATQAVANGFPVAGTGSDLADFLLGVPGTSSIAFGNADKYFRASSYAAYITDDLRLNPGLTANIGMRWEYGSPISELYGRLVSLDITPGFKAAFPVVASSPTGALTGKNYPDSLIRPDRGGVQPRIGISWRPFPASSMIIRAGYGIYYNTSVYNNIALQMAQQSPLSKTLSVQNSADHPLTLANGFIGSPAGTANTFAIDPDFQVGYVQNWQLSIQRDLPGALVMIATYLGSKGTRGIQQFLPNTYPAGAANPCPACPAGFVYLASNGNSIREAGQIQLRRRLQSGFTATVQYTFAKAIDDAAPGGRGQGAAAIAQNWLDLRAERGLSSFDQRHLMSLQLQYTSGMGVRGGMLMSGWRGRVFKQWTFLTQINAGSGFPLTPVYLRPVSGTGVTGTIRPDYTGAPVDEAPAGRYLNPASYAAPAPGRWGNAGRNSIAGPGQFSVNVSLGRTFRVRDRVSLDLRVDSNNALNHVTFPSWNTTVTSSQFGLPAYANPMRTVQTTLRARF
jgi:hypothetical protein